jgi:hypothetical protein
VNVRALVEAAFDERQQDNPVSAWERSGTWRRPCLQALMKPYGQIRITQRDPAEIPRAYGKIMCATSSGCGSAP